MSTRSEGTTAIVAVAVLGLLAASAALPAQVTANPTAPRLLVGTLRSSDKKLAAMASEELRSRLASDIASRQLMVIASPDYKNSVEQSGYPYDEALSTGDLASLARILRADEFVEGTVDRTATGFVINANLTLTRDQGLTQPLPPAEGERLARAVAELSKSLAAARKQLEFEKQCNGLGRDGKPAAAIAAARQGSAAYPRATLVRLCELNVRAGFKQPPDSIIAAALEVLRIDPENKVALGYAADQYKATGDQEKATEMLMRLLATDPTNARLVEDVVNALGSAGRYDAAKPLIATAIAENPGDVRLVSLGFRVFMNAGDTDLGAKLGEEMVKLDSALADSAYFIKLIAAFQADSAYAKSAELAQAAVAKFPQQRLFWIVLGTDLRRSGQIEQAAAAYRRWLVVDPKAPARVELSKAYAAKEQFDSALVTLREARAAGEDAESVGAQAFAIGLQFYKSGQGLVTKATASQATAEKASASEKAQASRSAAEDRRAVVDQFRAVVDWMTEADSAYATPENKNSAGFIVAVAGYYVASFSLVEAQAAKAVDPQGPNACEVARVAQTYASLAQGNVVRGGKANPEAVGQLMAPIATAMENAGKLIDAYCKKP